MRALLVAAAIAASSGGTAHADSLRFGGHVSYSAGLFAVEESAYRDFLGVSLMLGSARGGQDYAGWGVRALIDGDATYLAGERVIGTSTLFASYGFGFGAVAKIGDDPGGGAMARLSGDVFGVHLGTEFALVYTGDIEVMVLFAVGAGTVSK